MRPAYVIAVLSTCLLIAPAALAQEQSTTDAAIEALLGALNLPQVIEEAVGMGVPDSTLTTVLEGMRADRLPADQAESVLQQEVEVIRAGGPVDNFGAFVQGALASGLRGRELAAAIRAEHRNRGIGIPARRPDREQVSGRGRGSRQGNQGAGRGRGNGRGTGGAL